MAIDTAAKRLMCLDFEEVWAEAIPIPDGTISEPDRLHLLWAYSFSVAAGIVYLFEKERLFDLIEKLRSFSLSEGSR